VAKRGTSTEIGAALGKLVRRLDRSSGGGWRNVRASEVWPDVVGPTIAAHTGRVYLRGDEMVVYVDSAIWAAELAAMSEMLRGRVNQALGKEDVRSIRFAVSREVSVERQRAGREECAAEAEAHRVEPVPLTQSELEAVRRSVAAIENAELREAAFRATVKHLEWSRGIEGPKTP
jgi:Dna[CI] antecedent, DciA